MAAWQLEKGTHEISDRHRLGQEVPAEPVTVGDVTVTPRARALVVRLPRGGFVWNRPSAVLVERAGEVTRLQVWDVTRILPPR